MINEDDLWCQFRHALVRDLEEASAILKEHPELLHLRRGDETVLHWLAIENHIDAVRFLIERGADVNSRNDADETPLRDAASIGHLEMCQLLLASGADPNVLDACKETPLHVAAEGNHVPVMKALLAAGAGPLIDAGWPGFAAFSGSVEAAAFLLDIGIDVNIRNRYGGTPLMYATNCPEMVEFLARQGADVMARNDEGSTALHFAARGAEIKTIKLLIALGADVDARDDNGETPLDSAMHSYMVIRGGNKDAVRVALGK